MAVLSPKNLRGGGTATRESLWLCLKWRPLSGFMNISNGIKWWVLGLCSQKLKQN